MDIGHGGLTNMRGTRGDILSLVVVVEREGGPAEFRYHDDDDICAQIYGIYYNQRV